MTSRLGRAACTLVCLFSWACSVEEIPATEVVVSIDSNIGGKDAITHIEVELKSADGKNAGETTSLDPEDFPITFGIVKKTQGNFLLIIKGYAAGSTDLDVPDVETRVLGSFVDKKTRLLKVLLSSDCLHRMCGDSGDGPGATCYATARGSVAAGQCGTVRAGDISTVQPDDEDITKPRPFDEDPADAGGGDIGETKPDGSTVKPSSDGGTPDATTRDATTPDAASKDGGVDSGTDATTVDTGSPEAGRGDTGPGDTGPVGPTDAGSDAGSVSVADYAGVWSTTTGTSMTICDDGSSLSNNPVVGQESAAIIPNPNGGNQVVVQLFPYPQCGWQGSIESGKLVLSLTQTCTLANGTIVGINAPYSFTLIGNRMASVSIEFWGVTAAAAVCTVESQLEVRWTRASGSTPPPPPPPPPDAGRAS